MIFQNRNLTNVRLYDQKIPAKTKITQNHWALDDV